MEAEAIQEHEYDFPYHHLVQIRPFSETRHLFWGYRYAAYIEKILDTLKKESFDSLIDIGCGDGKILKEIATQFPHKKVIGVDYSEKSLRFARAFSPDLLFQQKTDEKFDAFVMIEVLEHINPSGMKEFLDGVHHNLNDKALGVITVPSDNDPVLPKHHQHFNEASMRSTLGNHFEIISLEYLNRKGVGAALIQRLLANQFFILNYPPLVCWLYSIYKRAYLHASAQTGAQILALVQKK